MKPPLANILGVLKALPDVPLLREQIHAKLADIYLRGGDRKAAVTQLEAIVKADPLNPQAYFFLGEIAYEGTNYAKAVEYLRQAVMLAPDFEVAYSSLATAELGAHQPEDALKTLEKARDKFGKSFATEMLSGIAASMQKDYTNAVRFFTAAEVIARATDPRRLNHVFYFQAGAAHERRGDFLQAEIYLKKTLELSPDYTPALNYLGYMWADRGEKLEEAKAMIEKALKAEPKNGAYLDSMAWVLVPPKPAPSCARTPLAGGGSHGGARSRRSTIIWATFIRPWAKRKRPGKPGANRFLWSRTRRLSKSWASTRREISQALYP